MSAINITYASARGGSAHGRACFTIAGITARLALRTPPAANPTAVHTRLAVTHIHNTIVTRVVAGRSSDQARSDLLQG